MAEEPNWEFRAVKEKFGDPLQRTLAIDDSQKSQEAVAFINKLGINYSIERIKDAKKEKDIVFPNILVAKNGTYLRGLSAIKFFRWELQPTIKETIENPKGAERVMRIFYRVDKELEEEGFFEEAEEVVEVI